MNIRSSAAWLVSTLVIALLQSCAALSINRYGPDKQTRDDFEHRVEAAFRLENRMTSEVMVLQEDQETGSNQEAISQAEQVMQKNCRYLNEYASRDIDGLSKSLLLLKHVENSVVDCEKAARQLEVFLKKP
ncbi:MAG: hypothetical protein ABL933_11275 [Methyloglobulus sp.]|nr:hypothetical protein [Methyloglobulus sp.]